MDVRYPAIREIPVIDTDIGNEISSSCLPRVLKPTRIEGCCDVSGKYQRVGPGMYVYHFDNMKSASRATMRHFKGLTIITEKVFDKEVPKTFPEFHPPMKFVPNFVLDEHLQHLDNCSTINAEAMKGLLKASLEDNRRANLVEGNEVIRNQCLRNWLNIHYSDFVIQGNEYLDESSVTLHQSSKPDFCLFVPKHDRNVISAAAIDLNDAAAIDLNDAAATDLNDDPFGLAVECKDLKKGRPQIIANMVAVAGSLAMAALLQGRKFHKITVYGLECHYSTNEAVAKELTLDFKERSSVLVEYQQKERIGKQIALVTTALRQTQK